MSTAAQRLATPEPPSLAAAGEALAAGDLTAVDLCKRLLERHDAVDGDVRAYLELPREAVLEQAAASDARRADGTARGPLDGLPIAIKDCISVQGERCTCASKLLEGYTATYDATAIARLRTHGAIFFGRTNMDEFAMGGSTLHSGYWPTRNPHDLERVPGGSSGGSAAAVASGQALAALGSDTGGSIRQPASFCGVVGLKPTYGRVSRYGLVAYASSLDQIGPITRDVRDAALLLDVIAGHDPHDCTSLPAPAGDCAEALAEERDVRGLRVGLPGEFWEVEGLDDEVRDAVTRAVDALRDAGAEIVDVSLPRLHYGIASYYVIATAEASSNLARFDGVRYGNRQPSPDLLDTYFKTRKEGFGTEVKRRIILGTYVLSSGYYDAYYLRAQKVRTLMRDDFTAAFADCDIIVSPAAPTPAPMLGAFESPLQEYLMDVYTVPVNLAGICGISVPWTTSTAGLPIGVQFMANALEEPTLLRTAHWLEANR